MKKKKENQKRYLQVVFALVLVLALVRWVFPSVSSQSSDKVDDVIEAPTDTADVFGFKNMFSQYKPTACTDDEKIPATAVTSDAPTQMFRPDNAPAHRVRGVGDCAVVFNDSNYVQLVAAEQWGVSPVKDRADAEQRKSEVVFMGMSPFYDVARLDASIPYLVPRASILLNDIGINFMDSLHAKHLPMQRMVVSSVLRSQEDIGRLRRSNKNAVEKSCHLYGTTFDINYSEYTPVVKGQELNPDLLKMVLSEVLRDLHQQGRCYVKHEKHQPCFHITIR